MSDNYAILDAFTQQLHDADLGYPVAWPGADFQPPASGVWLRPMMMPNRPIQIGTRNSNSSTPLGILQVIVYARPALGIYKTLMDAAQEIADLFPRGHAITSTTRVQVTPYCSPVDEQPAQLSLVVTIPYIG